jgi:hypothetical protein
MRVDVIKCDRCHNLQFFVQSEVLQLPQLIQIQQSFGPQLNNNTFINIEVVVYLLVLQKFENDVVANLTGVACKCSCLGC